MLAEEVQHCQAFMEACGAALWACPIKDHGVLMYALQILTGNMPLATMLATTLQPATVGREPSSTASHSLCQRCQHPWPELNGSAAHPTRKKWHWNQRKRKWLGWTSLLKSIPTRGRKRGSPLQGSSRRTIGKLSEKTLTSSKLLGKHISKHHPSYDHEGSHDLSCTFQDMATTAGLMGSEVHKVQEVWTGWKDLQATHYMAKGSPKGIQFFWMVPPTKSPKIVGLRRIHSPKALHRQVRLSFYLWCGKEGQNEGTVVNHLWTSHYHLGLVCSQCLKHFTTSVNAMCCHLQLCKPSAVGINNDNDDQEEESDTNDDGEDNFVFS